MLLSENSKQKTHGGQAIKILSIQSGCPLIGDLCSNLVCNNILISLHCKCEYVCFPVEQDNQSH